VIFMEVSPLMNNTVKTSVGEDSVKIRPAAVTQQWRQKTRKTRSSAITERPRALPVTEYFAKSLNVTQGHSK